MKPGTGLKLRLISLQGLLLAKNPGISCRIDGIEHVLKFGDHMIELTPGEHRLVISVDPFMGYSFEDQSLDFTVKENMLTLVGYKVNMMFKSSVEFKGYKTSRVVAQVKTDESNSTQRTSGSPGFWDLSRKAAGSLGSALGRLAARINGK